MRIWHLASGIDLCEEERDLPVALSCVLECAAPHFVVTAVKQNLKPRTRTEEATILKVL